MNLTKKQQECYDIIKAFNKENGYCPTYREISAEMNLKSSAGPYRHIKALKEKGLVSKESYRSRTIKLTEKNNDLLKAQYWLIHFQEHFLTLSGTFEISKLETYVENNKINTANPDHSENINKIKSEYLNQ